MEAEFQLPNSNFGPMLGAIDSGRGPGGGVGFNDTLPQPFDIEVGEEDKVSVVRCRLVAGAIELKCEDKELDTNPFAAGFNGWIWARIDHTAPVETMLSVECGQELPEYTIRYTIRTLYEIKDGEIAGDYRTMPVLVILT